MKNAKSVLVEMIFQKKGLFDLESLILSEIDSFSIHAQVARSAFTFGVIAVSAMQFYVKNNRY